MPGGRASIVVAAALAVGAAGCGSLPASRLPAPYDAARPVTVTTSDGRLRAVLDPRARAVDLFARGRHVGTQPAGVGPVGLATNGSSRVYVADPGSDGLLVYRLLPDFAAERRLRLPGEPYAIAADPERYRLYVTLRARDLVVEMPLHGRPHVLNAFATPHRPERMTVAPGGDLLISGGDGARARIDPRTAPPRR